jgi:hypothetical protein
MVHHLQFTLDNGKSVSVDCQPLFNFFQLCLTPENHLLRQELQSLINSLANNTSGADDAEENTKLKVRIKILNAYFEILQGIRITI